MPARSSRRRNPAAAGPPVRVRMYRSGLGDCFLITFAPGDKAVHVLIDCGSLGAKTTGVKLSQVVADIRKTTGDHLHLLIATHEHKDHVCGFRDCMAEFKKIKVDRVWMAWTENPRDKDAAKLKKYASDLGTALYATGQALTDSAHPDARSQELGAAIQSILGFAGESEGGGIQLGAFAKTVDEAMTFVRTGCGSEAIYLSPGGAAIEESWLPGFRIYVLGPPRSRDALGDLGDHDSEHLYHVTSGLRVGASGEAATYDEREGQMPFDPRLRLRKDDPLWSSSADVYEEPEESWRRIDNDWLNSGADLALQLDNLTNNTSLALAIERVSDGRILLFPADAQQGNWLSWHKPDMRWTYRENDVVREKTAEQLLSKTVFYKVGHHGSHNATSKDKGLEMMGMENELVAFIPVDRAVALTRSPKGSWQMPARGLYRRLLEKCQGRVVRSDLGWADDGQNAANKEVEKELAKLAGDASWQHWKQAQAKAEAASLVDIGKLYIDFNLG